MLITFIVCFVLAFVVLYYMKARAAIADGYKYGKDMLRSIYGEQVLGYADVFSKGTANYNYWYKVGVRKAVKDNRDLYCEEYE